MTERDKTVAMKFNGRKFSREFITEFITLSVGSKLQRNVEHGRIGRAFRQRFRYSNGRACNYVTRY